MDPPPLSLADVTHDTDFTIDTSLDPDTQGLFLPEDPEDGSTHDHTVTDTENVDIDTTFDDAAVSAIKASLSQAQAQADLANNTLTGIIENQDLIGTEDHPIENATVHMAPYSRAERTESSPHPEHLLFPIKEMFMEWFDGEKSWCHYVQRRTTTPAKRSEERIKARLRAHEKMLMAMTPEEAANIPPLKRRKRQRTSPVIEKVTFTCHHAGSYTTTHSAELPQSKLRLNTKTSVKCNCPSKIVLTELESGMCKVVYYWKHTGHDPFSEEELDTGRVPKVVDDWLVEQIRKGKDTDEIRAMLSIPDVAKQEYVRKALADPSTVDPDLPPPIAFQMKIKYPDIYNRFRKLRGPIRAIKIPKCRQDQFLNGTASTSTPTLESQSTPISLPNLKATANDEADEPPMEEPDDLGILADTGMDGLDILPAPDHGLDHQFSAEAELDTHPHAVLARFAEQQGHSDLAQALLSLPRDPVPGEETEKLDESVAKAARAAAEAVEVEEEDVDDDKSDGWGDIHPL